MCANMTSWGFISGSAGLLFTLTLLLLLVGAGTLVWRRIVPAHRPALEAEGTPAMAKLRQRYAQGEISTEEYQERRTFLEI